MSTPARYLVTGGAGFIGSSLARALLDAGERVRVLDDFSTGHRRNLEGLSAACASRLEIVEGSVVDEGAVARAMKGVEIVFHKAAVASVPRSVERPLETDAINTRGTLVVLEAARAAGAKRVIYAGSSAAYGNDPRLPKREDMTPEPLSPYAVSKLAGEHYLSAYAIVHGLETVTLRYFNVFGPRQDPNGAYAAVIPRWCHAALSGEPIVIHGDGGQTRDFGHIDNIVHANLLAGSTKQRLAGEVVNVSCGERISLLQLADAIEALTGRPLPRSFEAARAGDVRDSVADISRARSLLGYEPRVFWRDGLARTIEALRAR